MAASSLALPLISHQHWADALARSAAELRKKLGDRACYEIMIGSFCTLFPSSSDAFRELIYAAYDKDFRDFDLFAEVCLQFAKSQPADLLEKLVKLCAPRLEKSRDEKSIFMRKFANALLLKNNQYLFSQEKKPEENHRKRKSSLLATNGHSAFFDSVKTIPSSRKNRNVRRKPR